MLRADGDRPFVSEQKRIVFVQHGDYREAAQRFAEGGDEAYAAQRYSVELVANLTRSASVTVITLAVPDYRERLDSGVLAIGLSAASGGRPAASRLLRELEGLRPTHLVLRTPWLPLLAWSLVRVPHVLPLLADSFASPTRLRQRLSSVALSALLNAPKLALVGNHNVPACEDLVRLGVSADKVVPWDWPAARTPDAISEKPHPGAKRFSLFYAGTVSEAKGVTDLLESVAGARAAGVDLSVAIAGGGELDAMRALATRLGIGERVELLGRVPNQDVFQRMRDSDLVVVPSRHAYPEGLPMTIYEGLCSRTPLLLSDHPMFIKALAGSPGCRFFEASRPEALQRAIVDLLRDPSAYAALSTHAPEAWQRIQVPLKWGDLLETWLEHGTDARGRLRQHTLAGRALTKT